MNNYIIGSDGVLRSGWVRSNPAQNALLVKYLKEKGVKRLSNPVGPDLTNSILSTLLEHDTFDVIVKADNGVYQAILVGERSKTDFLIQYLASVAPGAGETLINTVKDYVTSNNDGLNRIMIKAVLEGAINYYKKRGFVLMARNPVNYDDDNYGEEESWYEWRPQEYYNNADYTMGDVDTVEDTEVNESDQGEKDVVMGSGGRRYRRKTPCGTLYVTS